MFLREATSLSLGLCAFNSLVSVPSRLRNWVCAASMPVRPSFSDRFSGRNLELLVFLVCFVALVVHVVVRSGPSFVFGCCCTCLPMLW